MMTLCKRSQSLLLLPSFCHLSIGITLHIAATVETRQMTMRSSLIREEGMVTMRTNAPRGFQPVAPSKSFIKWKELDRDSTTKVTQGAPDDLGMYAEGVAVCLCIE